MDNPNKQAKYLYTFGNNFTGFLGYTDNKELAKEISKHRKSLSMLKIENKPSIRDHLSVNNEFYKICDDVYMTGEEENYFYDSFEQFKLDAIHYIDNLHKSIKFFKFTNSEFKSIKYLIGFLLAYEDYMLNGRYEYDRVEEEEEFMFDYAKAAKYFLEEVLES